VSPVRTLTPDDDGCPVHNHLRARVRCGNDAELVLARAVIGRLCRAISAAEVTTGHLRSALCSRQCALRAAGACCAHCCAAAQTRVLKS
jgi:hypothetical protein